MKPVIDYFVGVRHELGQVTWPSLSEVVKLTVIVLLFSAIVGAYVGLTDLGFTKLLSIVIK